MPGYWAKRASRSADSWPDRARKRLWRRPTGLLGDDDRVGHVGRLGLAQGAGQKLAQDRPLGGLQPAQDVGLDGFLGALGGVELPPARRG